MPGIGITDVLDQTTSLLRSSGVFQTVNRHEPKATPGPAHAACWVQTVVPLPEASGLDATTGRVEVRIRVYSSMLTEPQDEIDPEITYKTDLVMELFTRDFTLNGTIRNVDLLGAHGVPLSAQAGYLDIQGRLFRIMDITVPYIINDIWTQGS
jgi:hypothetical protein